MRAICGFFKSTILGGLIILVPIVVIGAIVVWAVDLAIKFVTPLLEWLPDRSVGGVSLTVLAALGVLLGLSFVAGLFAETAAIRFLGDRAERLAMSVPGYALMKNVGTNLVGIEGKNPVKTVLVRFAASSQIGFLMETLPDGRHVVFIPGVPRALVGTLHIVAADHIESLTISVPAALDALGRLGVGLREMWAVLPSAGTER